MISLLESGAFLGPWFVVGSDVLLSLADCPAAKTFSEGVALGQCFLKILFS